MNTAKEIFDQTMSKIKRLEVFEIKRDVGNGWMPNGTVPFDLTCRNGIATFKVYAEFLQDAEDQVTQYLERDEDE
jgi:hypothetical protein